MRVTFGAPAPPSDPRQAEQDFQALVGSLGDQPGGAPGSLPPSEAAGSGARGSEAEQEAAVAALQVEKEALAAELACSREAAASFQAELSRIRSGYTAASCSLQSIAAGLQGLKAGLS